MLRFSLVGCGRIAVRHAQLLGSGQIEGASLVGVCDLRLERARAFGEAYRVPFFTSADEMMVSTEPDVVVVLTESGNHASNVMDLARFRRHIIVEKPMALTVDDADAMIRACKDAGIRLFVVKQNRFNLPVVKLRQAVVGGRFGRLVLGTVRVRWSRNQQYYDQDSWRGTWALDGGVLANQASHHIDLLEWMMGPVETVFACTSTAIAKIEAEDTAAVVLRFQSGALGIVEATTATRPKDLEGSISILGEAGTVEIGGFAVNEMKIWNFATPEAGDAEVLTKFSVNPPNVYGFGHQAYYEDVVASLTTGTPHMVDGTAGRRSVELINAIYESSETRCEVRVGATAHLTRLGGARQ